MPSRPWYKWYPGDYLADTQTLSLEENGAYRALLDYLWVNGPTPPDEDTLAAIWRVDRRKVRRIYARLRPYFDASYSLGVLQIDHKKIAKQRQQVTDISKKRAMAGKRGGEANALAIAKQLLKQKGVYARARPDPDPEKDLTVSVSGFTPPSRARVCARPPNGSDDDPAAGGSLTDEQRAQAAALQDELEARRQALALGDVSGPVQHVTGKPKPKPSEE